MTFVHDLVLRGGTIVDGSGEEPFLGDLAIQRGRVAQVGHVEGAGREEIDAHGLVVTPGFVDIHTHYDGHASWDNRMQPSSAHGVTTVVMGNCGVGFAPCRREDHDKLIMLMEGVEDIPEVVLKEGLPWTWETFPDYLDFLSTRSFDMDVAAQISHAPLRVYVMGQRGVDREAATDQDIAEMARIAGEAVRSGALGFSTSRSINHRASDGTPIASLTAAEKELAAIAMALKDAGSGVVQVISDFIDDVAEFDIIRGIALKSGRPISFSLLQLPDAPNRWKKLLAWVDEANRAGAHIKAQVCGRPIGVLLGFELSYNPFSYTPSYAAIARLPFQQKLEQLRLPHVRADILGEFPGASNEALARIVRNFDRIYPLGDPPAYEPTQDRSIAAIAAGLGRNPAELVYDMMLAQEGRTILYAPAVNYAEGNTDAALAMMQDANTVLGLGDGGAHCGLICDSSFTTYMLTRWAKDPHGRMTLPKAVRALTAETSAAVGLLDRGMISPGYRADLNVIDMEKLALRMPHMAYDLPSGGGRLRQDSEGYVATIVAGELTYRNGVPTGALPGRLVRGAQRAHSA
jgi:N-acyl-D-aspartate/D-glutamate deacylase